MSIRIFTCPTCRHDTPSLMVRCDRKGTDLRLALYCSACGRQDRKTIRPSEWGRFCAALRYGVGSAVVA